MRYANYFQPLKTDAARGIKNIEKFDHKLLRMSTNERERETKRKKRNGGTRTEVMRNFRVCHGGSLASLCVAPKATTTPHT